MMWYLDNLVKGRVGISRVFRRVQSSLGTKVAVVLSDMMGLSTVLLCVLLLSLGSVGCLQIDQRTCKATQNGKFEIVRFDCEFRGNSLYEFNGDDHFQNVEIIIFDRISTGGIVIVIAHGKALRIIKINTGDEKLRSCIYTDVKVVIADKTCVSMKIFLSCLL